jgi:hypothetical protein
MKVECFFSQGCGSKERLRENLERAIIEEGIEAEVSFQEVSAQEAQRLGIGGSPTVPVDGRDIEPGTQPGSVS